MAADLPAAAIRTQVRIPLRFSDGYATTVLVTSFRGLVDNREHLALACGNPPDKAAQLERLGVTVAARVPTAVHLSEANASYLSTKARNGHHGLGSVHL